MFLPSKNLWLLTLPLCFFEYICSALTINIISVKQYSTDSQKAAVVVLFLLLQFHVIIIMSIQMTKTMNGRTVAHKAPPVQL